MKNTNTSNKISPKTVGILEMLLCATLWSIAGVFIKSISCNGFVIAGFRGLFAGLTTFIYIKLASIPLKMNKMVIKNAIFMCVLFICFVVSNKLTTAANAIVLQFTTPVWIMLISGVFMHQKLQRRDVIAALCTLVGVALCFASEMDGGHLWGNIIAIAAGLMMAFMYIVMGESNPDDRINGTLWGHLMTAIVGIPFILFTENTLNAKAFLFLIILGVVQLGVPYILLNLSSSKCPPLACCLLGAVEPLLNPVWVAIFDDEIPGALAILGGIVVIATVTIWCMVDKKSEAKQNE